MPFELSSSVAHAHLSHVLQGPHDSSIPLYLPLLFGFLSSFICGVLNFGEAMTFTLLWNFARYMSWLEKDVTFQKGVIFSQVMRLRSNRFDILMFVVFPHQHCVQVLSVFAQVPLLVVGWREFLYVAGYSSILLAVLNHVRLAFGYPKFHLTKTYLTTDRSLLLWGCIF
jgi:hypothetical protein